MKRKSILLAAILAAFVFVLCPDAYGQKGFEVGAKIDDFKLTDTSGKEQSFADLKGEKGTVLVFLSAQCPVVKGYNERINQIAADYASKGISFIGINSNATESLEWVKSEAEKVGYKFPVLIDKGAVLADKLGAVSLSAGLLSHALGSKVAEEAATFSPPDEFALQYRNRVDRLNDIGWASAEVDFWQWECFCREELWDAVKSAPISTASESRFQWKLPGLD